MINVTFNPINNYNVSFGRSLPPNYLIVEKIIKDYARWGFKSATDLEMRLPNDIQKENGLLGREFFINNSNKKVYLDVNTQAVNSYVRQKQLLTYKISSIQKFIEYYRSEILPRLYFEKEDDYYLAMKEIVKRYGFANCFECASLLHFELNKLGIPNRIIQDLNVDHCFVVVNRKEPFISYKHRQKGEFVADLWLKKTYKSVQEAQIDFNNRFGGVNHYNLLIDSSATRANILNRHLTKKEKEHNEKLLNSLTADWTFLEKNAKAVLVDGNFEDFKNKPSAAIIKKYFDDLSQLHYYFARNRRKNKIT